MLIPTPSVLQRITLILDESLEKDIIDEAQRLGAHSYICSYCSGKPLHNTIEEVNRIGSLVRIELLADLQPAQAILAYLRGLQMRRYALTALIDSVTPLSM